MNTKERGRLFERVAQWFKGADSVPAQGEVGALETHSFLIDGFLDPITLFTPAQCRLILRHIRLGDPPPPSDWYKGLAITDRFFYDLATRPSLLNQLKVFLGDQIILWGASFIEREPGAVHPWHVDIESSPPDGKFVSVWIGLENTSRESSLQLISRSHKFGKTVQQVVQEHGLRRGQATNDAVLRWARKYDRRAAFIQPDMRDGQAIIFDGRLWHATENCRPEGARTALLLQYATADTAIFRPDFDYLEWPFRLTDKEVPRILITSESPKSNGFVPAPQADATISHLNIFAQSASLPFAEDSETRFRSHTFFRGSTPTVEIMNCHMSVLSAGHSPHPPHVHVEEELLIVLDGEADIVLNDRPAMEGAQIKRLGVGSFVFHPAYQYHTIRNPNGPPVTYLMFKWRAAPGEIDQPLGSQFFDIGKQPSSMEPQPFQMRRLFESPTAYLGKLHAHFTDLQPGAGYPPHHDDYDVAIVVFDGKVETVGQVIEPLGVVFYAAGEMHGMKNVGDLPAHYLVFEFHSFDTKPIIHHEHDDLSQSM